MTHNLKAPACTTTNSLLSYATPSTKVTITKCINIQTKILRSIKLGAIKEFSIVKKKGRYPLIQTLYSYDLCFCLIVIFIVGWMLAWLPCVIVFCINKESLSIKRIWNSWLRFVKNCLHNFMYKTLRDNKMSHPFRRWKLPLSLCCKNLWCLFVEINLRRKRTLNFLLNTITREVEG